MQAEFFTGPGTDAAQALLRELVALPDIAAVDLQSHDLLLQIFKLGFFLAPPFGKSLGLHGGGKEDKNQRYPNPSWKGEILGSFIPVAHNIF
ncbi:hypothetical protein GCM10027037_00590 [Mucilaginibacter koreensis]